MPVSLSVVLVAIGMSAELASASGNQALGLSQTSAKMSILIITRIRYNNKPYLV